MSRIIIESCRNACKSAVVAAFVISVLFSVGFYLFPLISDDLNYRLPFKETLPAGYLNIHDVFVFLNRLYHYDNIRLANIVMVMLLPLPKWIGIAGSGCALFYVMTEGLRLSGVMDKPLLWSAWLFFVVFALPWGDQLYVFDFQLNYVWAASISLLSLRLFLNNGLRAWKGLLIGLVAGLWHEGFSIPLVCALVVLMSVDMRYRSRSNKFMIAGVAIGLMVLLTAPAIFHRLKWTPWFDTRSNIVYLYAVPSLLYLSLSTAMAFTRLRVRVLSPVNLALIIITVVAMAIMIVTLHGPRVGWLGIVASGIGMAYILSGVDFFSKSTTVRNIIAVSFVSLCALHLTAVDLMCRRLDKEMDEVLTAWNLSPESTLFHDLILRDRVPLICLQRPYYDWFAHQSPIQLFGKMYGVGDGGPKVVPSVLKSYRQIEPCIGGGLMYIKAIS